MTGTITRTTGSWYYVRTQDRKIYKARLRGKFKTFDLKVTNPIAVGDMVDFEFDESGESVFITNIHPRHNYIIRKSVHKNNQGHLIATNIDQSLLVVTLAIPRTSTGFIDRFLVSCEAFRIPAVLVFNKCDVYNQEAMQHIALMKQIYEPLGYRCIETSVIEKKGLDELINLLKNKTTLLSGHSGVGKSSIINALIPGLELKTAEVSAYAEKGVHTTTFAEMFEMDEHTFIIDTPGIKELGIFEIGEEELSHYFPEMRDLLGQCKFHNCRHVNEPQCIVREKTEKGEISKSRYISYISMLEDEDNRR